MGDPTLGPGGFFISCIDCVPTVDIMSFFASLLLQTIVVVDIGGFFLMELRSSLVGEPVGCGCSRS
jgi:hypothetical protein